MKQGIEWFEALLEIRGQGIKFNKYNKCGSADKMMKLTMPTVSGAITDLKQRSYQSC